MDLPSDPDAAAEYSADAPAQWPQPSVLRNLGFWLLALLAGSLLLLLWVLSTTSSGAGRGASTGATWVAALTAATVAGLSLAALPLLLPLLPWALGGRTVALRWLRVFTLQSASLGLLLALVHFFFHLGGFERAALPVGTIYFAGGLLAANLAYTPWLWPDRRVA